MVNKAAIQTAMESLKSQEASNVSATARKFKIHETTLRCRYKGEQVSRAKATSLYHNRITDTQEDMLLQYIQDLTNRCLSSTHKMTQNLVEEMLKELVGINWVSRFCQRHKAKIKSIYLRNIDQSCKIADNSHHFELFLKQVSELIRMVAALKFVVLFRISRR